jgi:hypothetical protein
MTPTTTLLRAAVTRRVLIASHNKPFPSGINNQSIRALSMSIPRDVREFIDAYPSIGDNLEATENVGFYSNTVRCRPDQKTVDEIHEQ